MIHEHTLVRCGLTDGVQVVLGNPPSPATCDVLPQETDTHPNPHSGCQQGPVGSTCILGVKTLRVRASESRNHIAKTRGEEGSSGLAKRQILHFRSSKAEESQGPGTSSLSSQQVTGACAILGAGSRYKLTESSGDLSGLQGMRREHEDATLRPQQCPAAGQT